MSLQQLQQGLDCGSGAKQAPEPAAIQALTRNLTRGDETAFREFYDAYFGRLWRYLLVVTRGDEDSAKEALQATMVRVVRYIREFPDDPALWRWLTVLARSAIADHSRKRSRYLGFLDRFRSQPTVQTSYEATDYDERLLPLLEDGLASLEEADRDLVHRKYVQCDSVRQIAADLQTTEKAVESRLTRARRKMKDFILREMRDGQV